MLVVLHTVGYYYVLTKIFRNVSLERRLHLFHKKKKKLFHYEILLQFKMTRFLFDYKGLSVPFMFEKCAYCISPLIKNNG